MDGIANDQTIELLMAYFALVEIIQFIVSSSAPPARWSANPREAQADAAAERAAALIHAARYHHESIDWSAGGDSVAEEVRRRPIIFTAIL